MRIGRYLWALIIDHSARQCQLVFHQHCSEATAQTDYSTLHQKTSGHRLTAEREFSLTEPFKATLSQQQYQQSIRRIKDYISSGDCYQTNFTQHFSAPFKGRLWSAYLSLRSSVASPYSAFWQWNDQALLCCLHQSVLSNLWTML